MAKKKKLGIEKLQSDLETGTFQNRYAQNLRKEVDNGNIKTTDNIGVKKTVNNKDSATSAKFINPSENKAQKKTDNKKVINNASIANQTPFTDKTKQNTNASGKFQGYKDSAPINQVTTKPDSSDATLLDFLGGVGKTAATTMTILGEGVVKGGEMGVDAIATTEGWVAGKLGNKKFQKNTEDFIKRDLTEELMTKVGWTDELKAEMDEGSLVTRDNLGGTVTKEIGKMLPSVLLGGAIGGASKGTQALINYGGVGTRAFGGATEEALNEGAGFDAATKYAILSSATEIATEWVTGGIPGIKGSAGGGLDRLVAKGLGENSLDQISKSLSKSLIKSGYKIIGEGGEEALAEMINPYLKNSTYTQGEKINWENVIESAIVGGLTSGILNAPSSISDAKASVNNENINPFTENEKIVLNDVVQTRLDKYLKENKNLNEDDKKNVEKQIRSEVEEDLKVGNLDIDEIEKALGGDTYKQYKELNNRKNQLESELEELNNTTMDKMTYKDYSHLNQKITKLEKQLSEINQEPYRYQLSREMSEKTANDGVLQKSYRNAKPYEPQEIVENGKILNLQESAKKYFNNSQKTHDLVNTISEVINDKDYNVVFDDGITSKNGNKVNAKISSNDGEITIKINPNSDKAGEFLLIHEITHAIETDSMKQLVIDYASKNKDFNTALEDLKKTYAAEDVTDEILADISGQLFGNQEFINNLSTQNSNIFKKLYDKIIEFANKITGNSKEALFIHDLKNKWQDAYKKQNNNDIENKYSKGKLLTGEDVVVSEDLLGSRPSEKKVKKVLENMMGIKYSNQSSGNQLSIENKDVNKFLHDGYNNHKSSKLKKRISGNYGEILELSKIRNIAPVANYKSTSRGKKGFDYYDVNLAFPIKNTNGNIYNYKYYQARLVVRKESNGDFAYDLDNFAEKKGTALDKTSLPIMTDKSVSSSFSENNIPNSNKKVKNDILPTKYSIQNQKKDTTWDKHLKDNYKTSGTITDMRELQKQVLPLNKEIKSLKSQLSKIDKKIDKVVGLPALAKTDSKTLNPKEISKLTIQDASTTPKVPEVTVDVGEGKSHFFNNIKDKVNMLAEDSKAKILSKDEVKYYKEVTNEESLNKAFKRLADNGTIETTAWFNKEAEMATDVDVAEGWILMKQYEDTQNYDGMVQVAKKMRSVGTKAGQTVQAFNIMNRMTPEGMVKYAQSELSEAYEKMVANKTKKWIDKYRADFDLTPDETKFIVDTMKEMKKLEDVYERKVKLAEIQKVMIDKIPPEKGQGIKSWMRISMLFNPKTQVRNVLGNALIMPVNAVGDIFASGVDRFIAKKTGVRTTGTTNLRNYTKGMKQGFYQSYNDFKKGINTRNIEGDRFEIGEGKNFNDKTLIGKSLNRVDSILSFVLDAGDRTFCEGSFINSINNQMVLNNTAEVTQEMIDIATNEALSRTWQDNNKYTQFVLTVRKLLNNANISGYGVGDILIPFAKTPANLTKALIDYSPAGMVNTLIQGNRLKNALATDQYTAQMQHQFVQTLGKATAGTMLYLLGYALAKSGVLSGESDDDKDTANFMKNTMGVNSYSIKIGDKSFTYDWAQPIAGSFSIMANLVNKEKQEQNLFEKITSTFDTAGNLILEQSFMESINTVLSNNDGIATGIEESILALPSRTVPTLMKQITDLTDYTQRTTFEYDKPLDTSINKVKAKIPWLSKDLAPSVDTLGREIQKYGGKNNLFNVFLNPANVANENVSDSAKEIYRLYKQTGDKTIMPRVAPYYVNKDGEKIILSSDQKANFQKNAGKVIENSVNNLMLMSSYQNANDEEKADMVKGIIGYSYNIAQHNEVNTEISQTYNKAYNFAENGGNIENYYVYKNNVEDMDSKEKIKYLYNSDFENNQKKLLYENVTLNDFNNPSKHLKYKTSKQLGIDINNWLNYSGQNFESRYNAKGQIIKNSKKSSLINFVNQMNLSVSQKAALIKMTYSSYDRYDNQIMSKINSLGLDYLTKAKMVKSLGFSKYDSSIINYVSKSYSSLDKKVKVLEELGFNVYKANGKTYVR